MKKHMILMMTAVTILLAGCSAPATNTPDSSAEMESLKAQVDELKKENEALKTQLETTQAATEAETTEAPAAEAGSVLAIGEEGILKDWAVVVTSSEITDSIKENDYYGFSPEEGNKYAAIDVTVTNNGKNAANFLPSFSMGDDVSAKILYQGDYEFSATNLLGYGKNLFDTSVNPLSTKSGIVAFELPDSVASAEDELLLVISSGKDQLQFKIR